VRRKRLNLLREGFIARVERGAGLAEAAKIAKCSPQTLNREFSRYATLVNGELAGWAAVARMSDLVAGASRDPIAYRERERDALLRRRIELLFGEFNAHGIPELPGTTEGVAVRVYEAFYRKTIESPHGRGSQPSNDVEALHRFIDEYLSEPEPRAARS
jgi:hypothetical protein